jgi:hypothetical protein
MRLAVIVAVGCLGAACASSPAAVAPTTPAPAARPATPERSVAPSRSAAAPDHSIAYDELPPAFAQLSPRDRERWHACHIFFLNDRRTGEAPERYTPAPGTTYAPPATQHLGFSVTPADYVALSDDAARRAFLIEHGCPDSLVDLADGTHLDMIHP